MEKFLHRTLFAALIACSVALLSCQKDESDDTPKTPTVAIELTETDSSYAVYTITVENAAEAYYLTVESGSTEVTDDLLSGIGTRLSEGVNADLRSEGLKASTSYTVYALAIGADGTAVRDQKEFLTEEKRAMQATSGMGIYYGNQYSADAANYYFMLTDCPFENGMAQGAGWMIYFDCYGPASTTPLEGPDSDGEIHLRGCRGPRAVPHQQRVDRDADGERAGRDHRQYLLQRG